MADPGLIHALFQGLVTGSYIALGAIGLSLVYNIAKVPNFAHGELLMVGAYFALIVNIPDRLPFFAALVGEESGLSTVLLAGFFLVTFGATLGMIYLLGGMRALKGSWWPIDVHPNVALVVHGLLALAAAIYVVIGAPNIVAGLVLATVLLAVVAPLFDKYLFRKLRATGASLATMLIVTMGLAFAIRFSMQSVFEGSIRSYRFPRFVEVFGYHINLFRFKEFDFFLGDGGMTVRVVETATSPNTTILIIDYPWVLLGLLVIGTVGMTIFGYRWRRGGRDGHQTIKTFGPRLTAGFVGFGTLAVLAVVLAQPGSLPDTHFYATQIRNSYFRLGMIVIAVLLMLGLHILLKETKLGKAMRASADNLELAQVTGIDTNRVMMTTWIIAGAYAAIAGVFVGMLFHNIRPSMGFFLLLPLFAAVILGGLASVYGAIVGAYVVGISMEVGLLTLGLSGIHRPTIAFAVLLLVLLIRPEGIVGAR